MSELILVDNKKTVQVCDTLAYRGFNIDFYEDPLGNQVWCYWQNKPLGFGTGNWNYKEDLKLVIDNWLDTITKFEQFQNITGAKLVWFQNGDFRDIKLVHQKRLLKIFLVTDVDKVNIKKVINESLDILHKLGLDSEN